MEITKFEIRKIDSIFPDAILVDYGNFPPSRNEKRKCIREAIKKYMGNEKRNYSISHTNQYSVAVISKEKKIGIDIERKDLILKSESGMDILFPRDCKMDSVIRWSAHEVIGKMEGIGLGKYLPIKELEPLKKSVYLLRYEMDASEKQAYIEVNEDDNYIIVIGVNTEE